MKDYYDELLQTIKEIRLSERRQYQKITDIFEATSIGYNKDSKEVYSLYQVWIRYLEEPNNIRVIL